MALELKALEDELAALPAETRLQLARRLIDSVLEEAQAGTSDPAHALLAWAGRFNGGPGDTAERAEDILADEIGPNGFGDRTSSYLLDTGFLVALLNQAEKTHEAVRQATARIDATVYLPTPVIVEVSYLLQRDLGNRAVAEFVDGLADPPYSLVEPHPIDYQRAASLLSQYADARIDFVDTIIVAIAERLKITRILTLDQRHFRLFRPQHCDAFILIP